MKWRLREAARDGGAPTETRPVVPVVEMNSIAKTYDGARPVAALVDCDLCIACGEYLAIMGPSGSGKSTLLNMLGLLDEPTSGEYLLNGQRTARLSESRRCDLRAHHIGFVFQGFHLVSYRSAVENVETGLLYQKVPRRERRARAIEVLDRVGLATRMWAAPNEMSGGERQRVAVARAVVRRPALVLCDEPTGNLDTESGNQVLDLLDELNAEGVTIIVITHDAAVGARARRIVEIRDGIVHGGVT